MAFSVWERVPLFLQIQRLVTSWRSLSPSHSQWFSVLSQVHASTDQEIREMHDEQANPQNAVVREHGRGAAGWRAASRGGQGTGDF